MNQLHCVFYERPRKHYKVFDLLVNPSWTVGKLKLELYKLPYDLPPPNAQLITLRIRYENLELLNDNLRLDAVQHFRFASINVNLMRISRYKMYAIMNFMRSCK